MAIKNKIALITGSTQGIGKAIAKTLLQAGARVVINSRSKEKVQTVVEEFISSAGTILGIAADVGKKNDVLNLVDQVKSKWGTVDILVNNAGIARFTPVPEISENDWDEMLQINLKGLFLCSQAVLPEMIKKKSGYIVNIISVAARKTFLNGGAYAASKAGALAFTNVLREEVRHYNVRVTAVLPGATDTPLWESIPGNFPKERMMPPEAVAQAVLAAVQDPDSMVEEIILRPVGGDL